MKLYITLIGIFLVCPWILRGNDSLRARADYFEHLKRRRLWSQSDNAAGLIQENLGEMGSVEAGAFIQNGSYHRAQEGSRQRSLLFATERYERLAQRWAVWGTFNFEQNKESDRAWSDVLNTYQSNPFIFGSDIKGIYERQSFDFKAKLAHEASSLLAWGVGVRYRATDFSRLKDPRPRSVEAYYGISPSLLFRVHPKVQLGMTGHYTFKKEKMASILTFQENPDFYYYLMVGMENGEEPRLNPLISNGDGILRGFVGFRRQFVENRWGGAVQAQATVGGWDLRAEGAYVCSLEHVYGDTKRSPGEFLRTELRGDLSFQRHQPQHLHRIDIQALITSGYSNEFIQHLEETRDTVTSLVSKAWVTDFIYTNQYQVGSENLSLIYLYQNLDPRTGGYRHSAELSVGYQSLMNRYNYPHSELVTERLRLSLSYGIRILEHKGHTIYLKAGGAYQKSLDTKLILNNSDNRLAQNIWIPDAAYYAIDVYGMNAELRYSLPLRTKKSNIGLYIRCYTDDLITMNSSYKDWWHHGMAIGITTR